MHASIATVVPGDGAVRVLYGGDDYAKQAFNASWQGTLSPGSSFKTFALAAYLQNGGTVNDTFDGNSPYNVPGSNTRSSRTRVAPATARSRCSTR